MHKSCRDFVSEKRSPPAFIINSGLKRFFLQNHEEQKKLPGQVPGRGGVVPPESLLLLLLPAES